MFLPILQQTLLWNNVNVKEQNLGPLTSKFMEMGGRAHFFLSLVGSSSISALIWDSFIPAMRLILRTVQWSASHEPYICTHKHWTERLKHASRQQHLLPHNGVLTGLVFSFSFHADHLHSTSVQRSWNAHLFIINTADTKHTSLTSDDNVQIKHFLETNRWTHLYFLCQEWGLEIRFDDNFHLQLCASNLSDQRNDTERQDNVLSGTIPA